MLDGNCVGIVASYLVEIYGLLAKSVESIGLSIFIELLANCKKNLFAKPKL